jgi:hypothetical protein
MKLMAFEPVRLEDDDLLEGRVGVVVDQVAELVRDAAEERRLLVVHAMVLAADAGELPVGQVGLRPLLERLAGGLPPGRDGAPHLRDVGRDPADGGLERVDAAAVSRGVGLAVDVEEAEHLVGTELVPELLGADVRQAVVGAAVGGDDEDLGGRFAVQDELDPLADHPLLRPLPRLPDDEVDGRCAEEELMGRAVHLLAAEVPAVERDSRAVGCGHHDGVDLDAVGAVPLPPRLAAQGVEQAALAHLPLADQDQLPLVEDDLRLGLSSTAAGVHEGVSASPLKQGIDRRAEADLPSMLHGSRVANPIKQGIPAAEKQLLL